MGGRRRVGLVDSATTIKPSPLARRTPMTTQPTRIYFDGNSLGPPPVGVKQRLAQFVDEEWGASLIGGWMGHGWWDMPTVLGDRLGVLVGAAPGQVVVAESTTVLLYKLLVAALKLRPAKSWIVTEEGNFPTDRHISDSFAAQFGAHVEAVSAADIERVICNDTAVVCLPHINYRSGGRYDIGAITAAAHGAGALVLWDISHSTGAMDLHLDRDQVDLAVGCSYKFVNGGPGAPAFAYVAQRHIAELEQPITGWIGHVNPFSMSEVHEPDPSIRRLLSGTPPVLGMVALEAALDEWDGVDFAELRATSLALTDRFIELADKHLASHGFEVVTPRDHEARGSHVALAHEHSYAVIQAAIAQGLVGDFREPNLCRFGLSPKYNTIAEVDEAIDRIVALAERGDHLLPRYAEKKKVT
jgi:kynureninase